MDYLAGQMLQSLTIFLSPICRVFLEQKIGLQLIKRFIAVMLVLGDSSLSSQKSTMGDV
jgi:hypothetical protein